jgi:uncharacterized membrane protein YtjA (UPF0391 family)
MRWRIPTACGDPTRHRSLEARRAPAAITGGTVMLNYAIVFFVIAIVAAIFGFGGIAAGAASIAKILFFVFLAIALITFVMSLLRRGV